MRGKPEKFIGTSLNEDDCSIMVQQKMPTATGARWYKIINYCYAEFGHYVKGSSGDYGISRACLFGGKSEVN